MAEGQTTEDTFSFKIFLEGTESGKLEEYNGKYYLTKGEGQEKKYYYYDEETNQLKEYSDGEVGICGEVTDGIVSDVSAEAVRDKVVLITRFPMDSAYNQFATKVRISTIKEMEQVYVNGNYYRFYPKIREKDVGSDTSRLFIDTLQICNLYLKAIGGRR